MSSEGLDNLAKFVGETDNQTKFNGLHQSAEHFGFSCGGSCSVPTLKLEVVENGLA